MRASGELPVAGVSSGVGPGSTTARARTAALVTYLFVIALIHLFGVGTNLRVLARGSQARNG